MSKTVKALSLLMSRMMTTCLATLVAKEAGITEAPILSAPW